MTASNPSLELFLEAFNSRNYIPCILVALDLRFHLPVKGFLELFNHERLQHRSLARRVVVDGRVIDTFRSQPAMLV